MNAGPSITAVMTDWLTRIPAPVRRELRISEHVSSFLRNTYAKAISPTLAATMTGLPIIVDDQLHGGQWFLHENHQVTKSGDMAPAPDGMTVVYSPQAGWVAMNTEMMNAL